MPCSSENQGKVEGLKEFAKSTDTIDDGYLTADHLPELCANLVAALQQEKPVLATNLKRISNDGARTLVTKASKHTCPA